jgi:hypothetical protein
MALFGITAIASVAEKIFGIVDKIVPDADAKQKMKHEIETTLMSMDHTIQIEQIKVNAEEAKSTNWFVAGWRPAVGWCCVMALFYNFILYNFLTWIIAIQKSAITPPPQIPADLLYPLLFGMLGLISARTIEKKLLK